MLLLSHCDALLLVHDWRTSADVQHPQFEVDEATRLGIPIFGLMHEMQSQRDDGRAMASLLKWAKETPAPREAQRAEVVDAADAYRAACVQHRVSYDERADGFYSKPILTGLDAVAIAARDTLCAAALAG